MAATTVALAHFHLPLPRSILAIVNWQDGAVDLFFCLSGFTLCYVYDRASFQFSSYLTARVARVYPLYAVTLLLIAAVYMGPNVVAEEAYPASAAVSDFVMQALMLNAWPLIGSGVHWNFTGWSISVEWFCYIALFPLLLRLDAPRATNIKLLCLIALSAISYEVFENWYDERLTNSEIYEADSQWSYWVSLIRGVCGFTAGWIAFTSFNKRDQLSTFSARLSTPLWSVFATILVLSYLGRLNSNALVFLFPFLVLAAGDATAAASRLLAARPLHFLGTISYSIYMVHFPAFLAFSGIFGPSADWSTSIYAALVVVTFAGSLLSYFAIERPARDAVRRLRRTRAAEMPV